jgi:hypothetical protein
LSRSSLIETLARAYAAKIGTFLPISDALNCAPAKKSSAK